MADRQLEHLMAQLAAIAASIQTLRCHAPDLHAVAYERTVTGNEPVGGKPWPPPGVEHHGDPEGRELWHRLEDAVSHIDITTRRLVWAIGNLLSEGGSPEDVRGYREQIQRREYREQLRQQQRRLARGEYVPVRLVDQPPYPGTGGR